MKAKVIYAFLIHIFISGCLMASKNQDKEMKFIVSHYKVPCSGESLQLCFLIKKEDGKTEFLHDEIEGFDYQWGYEYTISVEKVTKGKAMADASSFTYKLKKIIKKDKIEATVTFELPLKYDDQQLIETRNGAYSYFGAVSIETSKYSIADVSKAKSGIFKYAVNKPGLVLVGLK